MLNNEFLLHYFQQTIHVGPFVKYLLRSSARANLSSTNHTDGNLKNTSTHDNMDGLTVVTAYFNLGSFQKGGPSNIFTSSLYRKWMTVFACIENPLVVYVDNDDDMAYFVKVRSGLPPNATRIIKIIRNETWAFGLESRITKIFKQPGYPQHQPNTVVPGYSIAMHAKYEVMQRTIRENPFHTKYFSWLDIGLFRELSSSSAVADPANQKCSKFRMTLPFNFSADSVAYTQVYGRNTALTPRDIVYRNDVWLCGCYFVGEGKVLHRWTQEYINATMTMLASNLMSTDQQVIYAMFNTMKPQTKIQTYVGDGRFDGWFHLGYISRTTS